MMSGIKDGSFFQSIVAKFFPANWWPAYRKPYSFTSDWFTYRIRVWKKVLKPLIESKEPIVALEIGTHEGRSALWLLENVLTHESSRLICVDPYTAQTMHFADRFRHNLELGNFDQKVDLIFRRAVEVLTELPQEHFDLIYVDGDHSAENIKMEAEASWPLLKPGGILIFDDYMWSDSEKDQDSPKHAIDEFLEKHATTLNILDSGYQMVIRKSDIAV